MARVVRLAGRPYIAAIASGITCPGGRSCPHWSIVCLKVLKAENWPDV